MFFKTIEKKKLLNVLNKRPCFYAMYAKYV